MRSTHNSSDHATLIDKELIMKIVAALVLSMALCSPAYAQRIPPPSVPVDIEVEAGFKPFLVGHAVGTQNFICAPAPTASGVDWLFIGPQATVFDATGEQIETHFQSKNPFEPDPTKEIQATWQHSKDTSAVWAVKLRGSTDANYVQPGAIEWLLLEMKGAQVGPTAGEKLAGTRFIQRVNTVGGVKPPSAECTPGIVNTRRLVPYEADYYFWK
jgi:Protein of unknown function (DUF3455)